MDAFDGIRERAAQLHATLVAKGIDPLNPSSVAYAAVQELDLELALLSAGDPALKGSRALYDQQSGTLCCEKTDDAIEAAMLIAHEVAHACIHTGSAECATSDIDPTRSSEAAPVGLQRVEDYGARERRELEADVFARELLFPRTVGMRLHVDEGLSATDIAARTNLPINLIRQQLFDVLFLPKVVVSSVKLMPAYTPRPDPSQDRAAGHDGCAFQLQAGPGTGKTRTLVKRVVSLLAKGVDPASILILTFSNRAAGELSERIQAAVPDGAGRIWIGTFHAFGLDLLRRYHDRFDLPPSPPLFDRSDIIDVLEEVLPILPLVHYRNLWDPAMVLRDVVGAVSRAKDEMVGPKRYRELAEAMLVAATNDEERKTAEKCLEIAQIYAVYEQTLQEKRAVDFGDLILRPALLLESDAGVRTAIRLRHRHILVDEYQDVNRASACLLRAVAGDGKNLWVVGDSRQSIYRFRGASSANMARFTTDYPGAAADQLDVNYRSTAEIVAAVGAIAPHMGASAGMLPLKLTADRGAGVSRPEVRRYETPDDELSGIAASIRALESSGISLREQAVLCRSNDRLNDVAAALEERGIPVLHLGSFFEREEVRDLLALLSIIIDPYCDGLARVAAMPRYGVSLQDVYIASRFFHGAKLPPLEGLAAVSKTPGLSANGRAGLLKLAEDLRGIKASSSPWDALSAYLLDRTDIGRQLGRGDSIPDRMRALAIWQLLNFVRDRSPTGTGLPIHRTLDRVRQLVLLAEERDLRQVPTAALGLDAVRLMTVHGSKGLEFECVHIPGLTAASFPASNRGQRCPPPVGLIDGGDTLSVSEEAKRSHMHEEECLFFVGVSRARSHLRLYLAKKQSSGKNRSPSPFLSWLPNGLCTEVSQPEVLAAAPGMRPGYIVNVVRSSPWHVTDSRIAAYERCPRRYFYTHVLGLGGARKATAFTRTHDCLHDLIDWLAKARVAGPPKLADVEAAFETIWNTRGPVDHAFATEYRRIASKLIKSLVDSGFGRVFREAKSLPIDLAQGRVLLEPSEVAELPDGTVVLRHVQTGKKRSDEYDRLSYALYHLAGETIFNGEALIEAIHLTDGTVETVVISDQKLNSRRDSAESLLSGISAGKFPLEVDSVTCPRCPHFFICPAIPSGPLTIL